MTTIHGDDFECSASDGRSTPLSSRGTRAARTSLAVFWAVGGLLWGPTPASGAEETVFAPDEETSEPTSSDTETNDSPSSNDDEGVEVISHGDGTSKTSEDADSGGVEVIQHDDSDAKDEGDDASTSSRSTASNADFRGGWGATTGVDTHWQSNEDVAEWRARLDLQLDYDLSSSSRVVLDGEFRHWVGGRERTGGPNLLVNAAEPRASFEARLGESYVLLRSDHWSFRAGHLVTSWGSTTLVRPGDVVNPTDATDVSITGGGGSRSLPQLAAELGYVASDWSIEAVFVPFFEPNRVTVFGRDTAVATPQNPLVGDQLPVGSLFGRLIDRSLYEEVQPLLLATSVPDERPENFSVGVRATATAWNTDFGLGYFFGWDRTPWLAVDGDLRSLIELAVDDGQIFRDFDLSGFLARNPEALELTNALSDSQQQGDSLITSEYRRRHSLVADVSRYIGPIGVRADVAVSPERTFVTRNLRSTRRTTIFGALGLSYERLIEDRPLAVTIEGYGLRPLPRDSSVNQWFVSESELGPKDAEIALIGEGLYGVVGAVQWGLPFWKLDLQVGGLADVSNGDVVFGGRLSRRWRSWLTTSIGGVVYEGPPPEERLSLGGLYDRNDKVQLTVGGQF
jgi:hypothetical protein